MYTMLLAIFINPLLEGYLRIGSMTTKLLGYIIYILRYIFKFYFKQLDYTHHAPSNYIYIYIFVVPIGPVSIKEPIGEAWLSCTDEGFWMISLVIRNRFQIQYSFPACVCFLFTCSDSLQQLYLRAIPLTKNHLFNNNKVLIYIKSNFKK